MTGIKKILTDLKKDLNENGGPYTAISQEIEYLNYKKIFNKLIYKNSNNYKYSLDLKYIIKDFDIVHIYGIWKPFLVKVFLYAKMYLQPSLCL